MAENLQQEEFLNSVDAQLILKYSTHGIGVPVGTENDQPFHSFLVDIYLYSLKHGTELKIGEIQFLKFHNNLFPNSDYTELFCELGEYEYYLRLLTRLFNVGRNEWLILENGGEWINSIWCLHSIAILEKFRGHGLAEMALENAKKVLMIPNSATQLLFGFALPVQFFHGGYLSPQFYQVSNDYYDRNPYGKLKNFYKKCGFEYLEDYSESEDPDIAEAANKDKILDSHLFFQVY